MANQNTLNGASMQIILHLRLSLRTGVQTTRTQQTFIAIGACFLAFCHLRYIQALVHLRKCCIVSTAHYSLLCRRTVSCAGSSCRRLQEHPKSKPLSRLRLFLAILRDLQAKPRPESYQPLKAKIRHKKILQKANNV